MREKGERKRVMKRETERGGGGEEKYKGKKREKGR